MKEGRQSASLFSGAGGLDAGFESAGFRTVLGNDVRKPAVETFSANFGLPVADASSPSIEPAVYLGSVEKLDFKVLSEIFHPEVLTGGPPCQDFSVVRGPEWDRRGIEARRGRLYEHFVRALSSFKPKAFVFENVPGLTSANKGTACKLILEDFSKLGYSTVFSGVVDASRLGVPQARKRLVVIGLRGDLSSVDFHEASDQAKRILFGANSLAAKYPLTPIEAFEGKTLPDLDKKYWRVMKEWNGKSGARGIVEDYLALNGIDCADSKELDSAFEEHEKILKELGYYGRPVAETEFPDGSGRAASEKKEVLERMRRIPPGSNCLCVKGTEWEVEGRGISLIYRRIHPLKPAYTVVAFGGGGTWGYHYERDRSRLTNRERARLQSFPDNFVFRGGVQQVRSQIGEAVPPLLAKRIAEVCQYILQQA